MRLDGLFLVPKNFYFFGWRLALRGMNLRPEEWRNERIQIAHALRGTAVRALSRATLQLEALLDIKAADPTKLNLSWVLTLMKSAMDDVRRLVGGHRSSDTELDDLAEAFARIPDELGGETQCDYRVIVLGFLSRGLPRELRDETYQIGREAVINAFRHSRAGRVEAELEYGAKRFTLRVRDNGCGIDPEVLRSGRNGNWGISNMRERSDRIGASLRIRSRVAGGTEVELSRKYQK